MHFNGMEAASILPEEHHKVDWKKCIICQEKVSNEKDSLIKRYCTSIGISKVVDCGEVRKEYNDVTSSAQE